MDAEASLNADHGRRKRGATEKDSGRGLRPCGSLLRRRDALKGSSGDCYWQLRISRQLSSSDRIGVNLIPLGGFPEDVSALAAAPYREDGLLLPLTE